MEVDPFRLPETITVDSIIISSLEIAQAGLNPSDYGLKPMWCLAEEDGQAEYAETQARSARMREVNLSQAGIAPIR